VDRLVREFCRDRFPVGVIAVDPSSPFSGGALLGDRVRMTGDVRDRDCFFRSMSAGGVMGGLARATQDAARVLDASGRRIILIETVGVGQTELDITQATDTVLVVLTPESGDAIQVMKAGLIEIADVFAINKADRPGADGLEQALADMLDRKAAAPDGWRSPVCLTSASLNRGVRGLYECLQRHQAHLCASDGLAERRRRRLDAELHRKIEAELTRVFWSDSVLPGETARWVDALVKREIDPQGLARRIVAGRIKAKVHRPKGQVGKGKA
jgi:LAO/AO transport system kinase